MGLAAGGVSDLRWEESSSELNYGEARLANDAPQVQIVRTVAGLDSLREVWNLWCGDPSADFDFYLASAHCRADFVRPHVMVVYRNGRPDCMLIGRLERCRLKLKVGYTTLAQPMVKRLFFLHGGLFGNCSAENCRLLLRELKLCLNRREADVADFARVTQDSNLQNEAVREFSSLYRGQFSPVHEHRWVALPGSFEQFMRAMPRKQRHELRRHEKRLAQDYSGKVHIHCYRHPEEIGELAREVEKVSAKTYQRAIGAGFQPDVETLESLRITASKGGLRGCVLYIDEQPCAFFIGKNCKSTFYGNFMGFDPQYGKYSPGLMVLMHSIEECFDPEMRATDFDLGWGDRHYKRAICNRSRQDGPMYLYPFSLRGVGLNILRSAVGLLDAAARNSLENSSLLKRLKKAWQRRNQPPEGAGDPDPCSHTQAQDWLG